MKNTISIAFCVFLTFSMSALSMDVTNATIHVLINDNNNTIVSISGDGQGQTNLCLSNARDNKVPTDRMFSFLLEHYMVNKKLRRISFDSSITVPDCGYPLVIEVR